VVRRSPGRQLWEIEQQARQERREMMGEVLAVLVMVEILGWPRGAPL